MFIQYLKFIPGTEKSRCLFRPDVFPWQVRFAGEKSILLLRMMHADADADGGADAKLCSIKVSSR